MRIHDGGPRAELAYPAAPGTSWGRDYGARSVFERDRPYIDDQATQRHVWQATSRWGSRPFRELERDMGRGGATVTGFFKVVWTRVTNALRGGG
jgi:hypothetical protein